MNLKLVSSELVIDLAVFEASSAQEPPLP